jgi:hypothetical protein
VNCAIALHLERGRVQRWLHPVPSHHNPSSEPQDHSAALKFSECMRDFGSGGAYQFGQILVAWTDSEQGPAGVRNAELRTQFESKS